MHLKRAKVAVDVSTLELTAGHVTGRDVIIIIVVVVVVVGAISALFGRGVRQVVSGQDGVAEC